MLTNAKRIEMCYSLLSAMLPNDKALEFGFDENQDKRIVLSYTNQTPRPDTKTVMYFTIRDEAYKQARSDPHHYTKDNVEVLEHMRQMTLTLDVYSKVVPIGTSNDVVRWLNSALISDMYEDWQRATGWSAVIENIEIMPDLSYMLQDQVWNNRAQLVVKMNYRDITVMEPVPMTRVPEDIDDVKSSIDFQIILKDHGDYPTRYTRYWGVLPTKEITEEDILTKLNSEESSTRKQYKTFDCTGGKYIFFVIPTALVDGMYWKDSNGLNFSDYDTFTLNLHQESAIINYTVCVVNNKQTGSDITIQIL